MKKEKRKEKEEERINPRIKELPTFEELKRKPGTKVFKL